MLLCIVFFHSLSDPACRPRPTQNLVRGGPGLFRSLFQKTCHASSTDSAACTADGAAGNVPLSRGDEEPLLVSDGDMWSQTNNALKWLHIPKVAPNAFSCLRLLLAI